MTPNSKWPQFLSWKTNRNLLVTMSFAFVVTISAIALLAIFYGTPFRDVLEDKLFDLRTIAKPDSTPSEGVLVVDYAEEDLIYLQGSPSGLDLEVKSAERVLKHIEEYQPRTTSLILNRNPFNYPRVDELAEIFGKVPNRFLGLIGVDIQSPGDNELPPSLMGIDGFTFATDAFVNRPTDVARNIVTVSYRDRKLYPTLPAKLAQLKLSQELVKEKRYVNYIHPRRIYHIALKRLMELNPQEKSLLLKDQHVFLPLSRLDGLRSLKRFEYIKTPFDRSEQAISEGTKVEDWMAIETLNLIHDSQLDQAPIWIAVLQTLIFTLFCIWVWRFNSGFASFLIVLAVFGLIELHGAFFSYFNVFIPLSDTMFFGVIAASAAGQFRLSMETKSRLHRESETVAQQDLLNLQSEFLHDYSLGLRQANERIVSDLKRTLSQATQPDTKTLFAKAIAACEEFRDYLLGFSQLANILRDDKRGLTKNRFPAHVMLRRVMQQFDFKISDKALTCHVDCHEKLLLETDETLLEHVIFNLVSNAVKYAPRGGVIEIKVERAPKRGCRIAVADNGPGIASQFHQKIFDKFYRIQDEKHHDVKGHGLGLYLTRYFGEMLGGRVSLISEPGKGAVFVIHLPNVVAVGT